MQSVSTLLALALLAVQAKPSPNEVRALVERLRSDSIEERERASLGLKQLGTPAMPALRRAARSGDADFSIRASRLLRVITVMEKLSPDLMKALPGVEERLASGDDRTWTRTFFQAVQLRKAARLEGEDFTGLVGRALKGARKEEKRKICVQVADLRIGGVRADIEPLLKDSDRYIRCAALGALCAIVARRSVPRILPLLKDEDQEVRTVVLVSLARLGDGEAVPEVAPLLRDADVEVRREAVRTMIAIAGPKGVPYVLALKGDQDAEIRELIIEALCEFRIKRTAKDLVEFLERGDVERPGNISWALAAMQERKVVPALMNLLNHKDPEIRVVAVDVLAGLDAKEAAPRFVALLRDGDYDVRRSAAFALRTVRARETVPALVKLLEEHGPDSLAHLALGGLGDKRAVPPLLRLLRDKDSSDQLTAMELLSDLGAREAIPTLIEILRSDDDILRLYSLLALVELRAKKAVPALAPLLTHPEPQLYGPAFEAIVLIDPEGALPILRSLSKHEEAEIRSSAIFKLGRLEDRESIPLIVASLKDPAGTVRGSARYAIAYMGLKNRVPDLMEAIDDEDLWGSVPVSPLLLLNAREVRPYLLRFLTDRREYVKLAGAEGLAHFGSRESIPTLKKLLNSRDHGFRLRAARTLARLGVPDVVAALLEDDELYPRNTPYYLSLNALRKPDVWDALKKTKLRRRRIGSPCELLRALSRDAALEVAFERSWFSERFHLNRSEVPIERRMITTRGGEATLLEALESILEESGLEVIVDDGALRVLYPHQAREFWLTWWAGERKK